MSIITIFLAGQLLGLQCSDLPALLDDELSPPLQINSSVAAGKRDFMLAWQLGQPYDGATHSKIQLAARLSNGQWIAYPSALTSGLTNAVQANPKLAFNGRYLLIWQEYNEVNGWDIQGAILAVNDKIEVIKNITLSNAPDNQTSAFVTRHNSGFAISWMSYLDEFYRPYVVTMDQQGTVLHQGYLTRSDSKVESYTPGWGYQTHAGKSDSVRYIKGQNAVLQSIDEQLWIAWEDKTIWSPGKKGSISWHYSPLTASKKGWSTDTILKAPSPLIGRTNGTLGCYIDEVCIASGASIVGRGQKMAPAFRFNPKLSTIYPANVELKRKHSGWDKATLYPLFNEGYSLYGPISQAIDTKHKLLITASVAKTHRKHEGDLYQLLLAETYGMESTKREHLPYTSTTPIRNPSVAANDAYRLVTFERALANGGIKLHQCFWQAGDAR
ncbi:hypothetical protein MIB92_03460 [Aestuariirhabdus sp. Z084]|uniref:hypothetical protein n=1 Tax=Aestuariirhabdus haliotis TaxID=2918751 RepID=UPI00201B43FD|nr:hypothetical protein [Aestuariirhabdus haliotis]MCL6414698.1 hypothetical protein [Aestuariirhabdus haliotis]MCL6418630.1 hypothetical protein [Aestuariirhabdus haliotis]